jgi:peptidylprolyl isomerase
MDKDQHNHMKDASSMRRTRYAITLSAALLVGLLAACSPAAPTLTPASPAAVSGNAANNQKPGEPTGRCAGVSADGVQAPPKYQPGKTWQAPDTVTYGDRTYCMILTTKNGQIVIELFNNIAPRNVNSLVFLARQGYYENITWHRVIYGFMAQTGDPTGTGGGGSGYGVPLEVNPAVLYDREGRLGIARTQDPNSGGSQFFITFGPAPNLNNGYTIAGQVVEGLNVLKQIKERNVDQNPNLPPGDTLESVRIVEVK